MIEIADECIAFSKKFNLSLSLGLAESALAGWSNYMSEEREILPEHEISAKLKKWEEDKHVVSIGGYYTLRGISCHYLGRYEDAAESLENAEPYLRGLSDNILNRLWYVFRFINGLKMVVRDSVKEKQKLDHCMEQVTIWASLGPILKPYLALMIAERAYHSGDFRESRRCYLDAIDSSRSQKFTLLEAFLNERLGNLLIEQQHEQSSFHLMKAVTAYQQCASGVKARQLIEKYSLVIIKHELKSDEESLAELLDVNYLIRATREITQQLDFNHLLMTILQAVMERLGARTGYLLIAEEKNLMVYAKGIKQDKVEVLIRDGQDLKIDTLSMAIVNYASRTGEMVVLDNAGQSGDFMADTDVQKQKLKSVLCVPLMKQQKVLGVLYLENNLINAVFTREHIELTKLLTAQASIALENTLLIQEMIKNQNEIQDLNINLEQRVEERTTLLNKANQELNSFAYVVSHDLKAPLRSINQLSGWLEEDYADLFDDDGRKQMELLRDRTKRMHEMIDGILQYSRVGRITEPEEMINLNKLISDVVDLIAPSENIYLELANEFPTIKGENLRLFQVFQNLLDNAIKYNDKETGVIELSCLSKDNEWQFCIADNGPGIDEKYQEKIFQLFQTLSPKDQSKSTGIGLSLIKKIVENWEGKIWLESEIGKGCRFYFTIPKRELATDEKS